MIEGTDVQWNGMPCMHAQEQFSYLCMYVYVSIHPVIHASIHQFIHQSIHQSYMNAHISHISKYTIYKYTKIIYLYNIVQHPKVHRLNINLMGGWATMDWNRQPIGHWWCKSHPGAAAVIDLCQPRENNIPFHSPKSSCKKQQTVY